MEETEQLAQKESTEDVGTRTATEAAEHAKRTEFDADAERARIREQVEAQVRDEYEQRVSTTQAATPEPEDDIDSLMFSDPKAYRNALTEQITRQIAQQIAPTLQVVEATRVADAIGSGLGDAGKAYLRENLKGVALEAIPEHMQKIFRDAAELADIKANPPRQTVSPERSTATGQYQPAIDPDLKAFERYLPQDQIREFLKQNP